MSSATTAGGVPFGANRPYQPSVVKPMPGRALAARRAAVQQKVEEVREQVEVDLDRPQTNGKAEPFIQTCLCEWA